MADMSAPCGPCGRFGGVRRPPQLLDAAHESPRLLAVGANADDVGLLAERALISRDDPQAVGAIPWCERAVVEEHFPQQDEVVVFAEQTVERFEPALNGNQMIAAVGLEQAHVEPMVLDVTAPGVKMPR